MIDLKGLEGAMLGWSGGFALVNDSSVKTAGPGICGKHEYCWAGMTSWLIMRLIT